MGRADPAVDGADADLRPVPLEYDLDPTDAEDGAAAVAADGARRARRPHGLLAGRHEDVDGVDALPGVVREDALEQLHRVAGAVLQVAEQEAARAVQLVEVLGDDQLHIVRVVLLEHDELAGGPAEGARHLDVPEVLLRDTLDRVARVLVRDRALLQPVELARRHAAEVALLADVHLGSGRIVASEIEAPNMLANLV